MRIVTLCVAEADVIVIKTCNKNNLRKRNYYSVYKFQALLNVDIYVAAGADVVGINCHFDPFVCLEGMRKMKDALDAAGIKVHLAVQPLAYMTPDASKQGFIDLPRVPLRCVVICRHVLLRIKWEVELNQYSCNLNNKTIKANVLSEQDLDCIASHEQS